MDSGRPIDHVVIAVRDLADAAARFEALGFTVTPHASHPDHMGTSNRLVQFGNHSFIELVHADRPHSVDTHDFSSTPRRFSFGAHIKAFSEKRDGMAALVLASADAHGDAQRFAAAGIDTYAPLDFERHATLPDGSRSTVAFSLAFATSPAMPDIAFYVCQNRFPENFWKPAFQSHANGAAGISAVTMVDHDPARHTDFLTRLTGAAPSPVDGGLCVPCGVKQSLFVVTPDHFEDRRPNASRTLPYFAGVTIERPGDAHAATSADVACGIFLDWQQPGGRRCSLR